jgi:drug/metabolite transporter (DMT)-like permease
LSALAVTCTIQALRTGDVAVVSPIIAAQPLPALVLSALFLRSLERLDFIVVLGALAIVLGVLAYFSVRRLHRRTQTHAGNTVALSNP